MKTVGIICEYNPLHLGHQKQFAVIRERMGADTRIVCCMSGNYVQRGVPALFDKSFRAKAAILAGADLVLELPITAAISSAEGFASGGVEVLSRCCDSLCFGTESLDQQALEAIASALLSDSFSELLREELKSGCSFPAARQSALEQMGLPTSLTGPNDILAVEYAKAVLAQSSPMQLFPIHREGDYHAENVDAENPSATSLRARMLGGEEWVHAVPPAVIPVFQTAAMHTMACGERAVLARLRMMSDADFQALPYGSEGLWRKLMKASRTCASLEEIRTAVKSKRYTQTRIDRMLLCAFLGISDEDLSRLNSYARILAFNKRGRLLLKDQPYFKNAGEAADGFQWELEQRCGDLYGLFSTGPIEAPGIERRRRVYVHREEV